MKLLKRTLSMVLVAAMLVTTFVCFDMTGTVIKSHAYASPTKVYSNEYYYAAGTVFIGQLAIYYSTDSGSSGKAGLTNAGYTVATGDLASGTGEDIWIYMGYKTTTSYALATKAVRNSHSGESPGNPTCITTNSPYFNINSTFYLVGTATYNAIAGYGGGVCDGPVDLNKSQGGDTIKVYASLDPNAGPALGSAVGTTNSGFYSNNSSTGTEADYDVRRFDGEISECTRNTGGDDDIYLHWTTPCTAVNSDTLRSNYSTALSILSQGNINRYSKVSWDNLYSKVTAADACLNTLNADGASTYNQSAIDTLSSNIASAVSDLKFSVGYDNLFHFTGWSLSSVAGSASNVSDTGFTWTASQDDGYTNQCQWIPCTPNTAYTLDCDIDNMEKTEIFAFYYATTSDTTWTQGLKNVSNTDTISFTTPAGCYFLRFRVDVNLTGASRTFSNFRLRKTENYDTEIASQITTYGSTTGYSLSTPTRTGYTFSGWWTGENGTGTRVTNGATITTKYNHTLYSCWVPNYYVVAYNGNGSTGGSTTGSGHAYNTAKTLTANGFSKTGYTFAGWATSASGGVTYSNQQSITNLTSNNLGTPRHSDPMFSWGNNSMVVYNNSGNGTVAIEKVAKEASCPTASGYMVKITNTGSAAPGLGGFVQGTVSAANKVYYHVFLAKVPVGYTFSMHNNPISGSFSWLTSYAGTGNWEWYAYKLTCSASGDFQDFGYVVINGAAGTTASPVTWYVGYTQIYEQTTAGNGVVNLYAKWTANTYHVAYNGNGSTSGTMSNSTHTYDTAKALTANGFTKTGYTFKGWATSAANANAGTVAYTDSQSVSNLTATNGGTATLYAVWKDETNPTLESTYKRVMADGTSGYYTYTTAADIGSGIDRVQFPTWTAYDSRTGQTSGQDDIQSTWATNTAASGTCISVNAASSVYRYQVLRSDHNNEAGTYHTHAYAYDVHQYLDGSGENRSVASGGGEVCFSNLTFYRNYTADDTTTLTDPVVAGIGQLADANGNATDIYNTYGKMNGNITPTRTGYTFLGWNTNREATTANIQNSTAISTSHCSYSNESDTRTYKADLYAIWTINQYTLTVNPNGGSYTPLGTTSTVSAATNYVNDYNTALDIANPVRTGYRFTGWNHTGSGEIALATQSVTGFTTATLFETGVGAYKRFTSTTSATGNEWNNVVFPGYTYTQNHTYKISGWIRVNTLTSGVATKPTVTLRHAAFSNDYGSTGIVMQTYTASQADGTWRYFEMTRTFTGTTVVIGDTSATIAPQFEVYTNDLNGLTNASISFDLKNIEIADVTSGTVIQNRNQFLYGVGNDTLTANWLANTYYVAYNGNGNTGGSTASSFHTYDTAKALTTNGFTKTGYSFAGWATSSSGSVAYSNSQSVTNLSSTAGATVTLYAKWTINSYALTINPNGGSYKPIGSSTAVTTSTAYSQNYNTYLDLANPTKTGYRFSGWTQSGTGTLDASYHTSYSDNFVTSAGTDAGGSFRNFVYDNSTTGYKFVYQPTYSYTAGHSYKISGWVRLNEMVTVDSSEVYVYLRHAAHSGDNNSSGIQDRYFKMSTHDIGTWYYFEMTRVLPATTTQSGSTTATATNPLLRIFTYITVAGESVDFDIKGIQVEDVTSSTVVQSLSRYTYGAGATTLATNWTANTYTVAYDGNTNTGGSTASSTHTYDTAKALTANGFTKAGYSFAGWATSASGDVVYSNGQSVTNLT